MLSASMPLPLSSTDAYSPPSAPQSPMIRRAKILGGHAGRQVAFEDDVDRFRHAQPQFAGRPQRRNFAAADAGAERAQPAEMGRVAVGAEDHVARQHKRLLAEDLVANAPPDFEKVADALLLDETADLGVVLRVARGRRGHGVVERDRQLVRYRDPLLPELAPDLANGRRIVVAQDEVGAYVNHFADLDRVQFGGACNRLLRESARHGVSFTACLCAWLRNRLLLHSYPSTRACFGRSPRGCGIRAAARRRRPGSICAGRPRS